MGSLSRGNTALGEINIVQERIHHEKSPIEWLCGQVVDFSEVYCGGHRPSHTCIDTHQATMPWVNEEKL
jgi:hypothetical protein